MTRPLNDNAGTQLSAPVPVPKELLLQGRTAVVTGAGRGLGRAAAVALAEAGAQVVLLGRTAEPLSQTAAAIVAVGGRARSIVTDVTDEQQVSAAAAQVASELGGADILVNNAGGALVSPFLQTDTAAIQQLFQLNVIGAMLCTRAFGAHMVQKCRGRVINIASVAALTGETNTSIYAASKGALISFSRTLAVEWARYGVTVNALAPGYFRTDLNAQALDNPEVADRLLKKIPMRRVGQPDELGPLLVYLASDASAFMTGSVLVIDGGQVAR
jgi:NAD(P)-dependent dehydrogenase (short-subunit alcohol dehydrogenase family)